MKTELDESGEMVVVIMLPPPWSAVDVDDGCDREVSMSIEPIPVAKVEKRCQYWSTGFWHRQVHQYTRRCLAIDCGHLNIAVTAHDPAGGVESKAAFSITWDSLPQ